MSNSKKAPYYFNTETKESSWEQPTGLSADEIKALPGADLLEPSSTPSKVRASHLLVKHSGSRRPSSWKEVCISSHFKNRVFNPGCRKTSRVQRKKPSKR